MLLVLVEEDSAKVMKVNLIVTNWESEETPNTKASNHVKLSIGKEKIYLNTRL